MADFDCSEFIRVADEVLILSGSEQAHLRTVAGRAYYSCYGLLRRRIIQSCGDCFGKGGKHEKLANTCVSSTNPHLIKIGKRLLNLLQYRVRADYLWEEAENIQTTEAEGAIDTARKVVEKIGTLQQVDLDELHRALK